MLHPEGQDTHEEGVWGRETLLATLFRFYCLGFRGMPITTVWLSIKPTKCRQMHRQAQTTVFVDQQALLNPVN